MKTFTPETLESIAKVQTLRALREAKHHWRAHYRSMPTAAVSPPMRIPCAHEPAAAGALQEKAA